MKIANQTSKNHRFCLKLANVFFSLNFFSDIKNDDPLLCFNWIEGLHKKLDKSEFKSRLMDYPGNPD